MKYLKVNNLVNNFGRVDYKGLDISNFIAGSQIYPNDLGSCLIATNENLEVLPTDVEELQEQDYVTLRNTIEDNNKAISQAQDPMVALQQQVDALNIAMANMMGV